MPQLNRPTGSDVVNVLTVTPGAIPSVGLFTAELIDHDWNTNLDGSVTAVQHARALVLLQGAGLNYADLTQVQYSQAARALRLACYVEYLQMDRAKRLTQLQDCESNEDFKEKIGEFYTLICNAWKVMGITDPFYCNTGYEGSSSVILEGKVRETPNDLISLC